LPGNQTLFRVFWSCLHPSIPRPPGRGERLFLAPSPYRRARGAAEPAGGLSVLTHSPESRGDSLSSSNTVPPGRATRLLRCPTPRCVLALEHEFTRQAQIVRRPTRQACAKPGRHLSTETRSTAGRRVQIGSEFAGEYAAAREDRRLATRSRTLLSMHSSVKEIGVRRNTRAPKGETPLHLRSSRDL
jgi:hypothetical protein